MEEDKGIEIKHRSGRVLFAAENAQDVRQAVEQARREGAILRGANLRDANLGDADLRGANLRDANLGDAVLWDANLWGADLRGADLRDANLWGANLRGANLRDANLGDADLRAAILRDADLGDANLRDADLRDANLWNADWQGLQLNGLPSGGVLLVPQGDGEWRLTVGCWSGTVDDLEELVAGDDWPEAKGHEQVLRRPGLEALVTLCRAHIGSVEAREKEPVQ